MVHLYSAGMGHYIILKEEVQLFFKMFLLMRSDKKGKLLFWNLDVLHLYDFTT